jgi:hypothetical protein
MMWKEREGEGVRSKNLDTLSTERHVMRDMH